MPPPPRPKPKPKPESEIGLPATVQPPGSALEPAVDRYDDGDTGRIGVDEPLEVADPEPMPAGPSQSTLLPVDPPAGQPPAPGRGRPGASRRGPAAAKDVKAPARSGRRSSTENPRVSSRRSASLPEISPEERAARRKVWIWFVVGILLAGGVATGAIFLTGHTSDKRVKASEALRVAGDQFNLEKDALANRRASEARTAYEAALKALTEEQALGGAIAAPAPEDERIDLESAHAAFALRTEIEKTLDRIRECEREAAAEGNLAELKTRLGKLGDPATDIEALSKDLDAYITNPVDPKAGPDSGNVERYPRLVGEAKLRIAEIEAERTRRTASRTSVPVAKTRLEIEVLMQQERFGEAIAKIQSAKADNPDGDFSALTELIEHNSSKSWETANAFAQNAIADSKSPGRTEAQRKEALAKAKDRLNQVVDHFGIEEYVTQAKNILAGLP